MTTKQLDWQDRFNLGFCYLGSALMMVALFVGLATLIGDRLALGVAATGIGLAVGRLVAQDYREEHDLP